MQVKEIITEFAATLAASAAIGDWAVLEYGRVHQVYVEYDTRNPPGEDECPYIALWPISRVLGRERSDKQTSILLELTVHDDNYEVVAPGNLTQYTGLDHLADFHDHVITAVKGVSLTCGAVIDPVEEDFETMDSFPYHQLFISLGLVQHLCIGTDPLSE